MDRYEIRFRRFGIITIAAVFFLIFVGGLVRSTGSGMGCPDWPKCFGNWTPPTDISQLPADYKTRFAVQGKEIADFDVFKTWTEYVNRLVGVTIGLFIFLTLIFSVPYLKSDSKIFWLSLLAFILVGIQGWIGAKVVSNDLKTWIVTIHMLIALVIVALLIYTITRSQQFVIEQQGEDPVLKKMMVLAMLVMLIQVISGTQVREAVDEVALRIDDRYKWVDEIGSVFKFHRSLSILNFLACISLVVRFRKLFSRSSLIYRGGLALILLMSVQALSGSVLASIGFPGSFQSIHLTVGSLAAGLQIFIAILLFSKTKVKSVETN